MVLLCSFALGKAWAFLGLLGSLSCGARTSIQEGLAASLCSWTLLQLCRLSCSQLPLRCVSLGFCVFCSLLQEFSVFFISTTRPTSAFSLCESPLDFHHRRTVCNAVVSIAQHWPHLVVFIYLVVHFPFVYVAWIESGHCDFCELQVHLPSWATLVYKK